jgi:uncharacterized membrane protein/protein-disulfide isomerase
MKTRLARTLLASFAFLGLAASTAATWVHYHLIENPDYASFCDVNARISCKQAYLSAYGSIGGVPVALAGVIFFALVLLILWGTGRGEPLRESGIAYVLVASTAGLVFVLYLAYASFFVLKEVCPLCVATYVAVIGLFAVSLRANAVAMGAMPARIGRDASTLFRSTAGALAALAFVVAAIAAVAAFPRAEDRPVAVLTALPADQRAELERWWNVQPASQVPIAAEGAKVLIVKFNDYQCPPCRGTYFAYEPIVAKYKDRPGDVKFVVKHFPLNPACNPGVTNMVHPAACDAAAAAVMARTNGTFDRLADWFYLHQDGLTPSTVRRAAADVGHITDFDARYAAAIAEVRADAVLGGKLGVESTPTFFINGRKVPGVSTAALDALIEFELSKRP